MVTAVGRNGYSPVFLLKGPPLFFYMDDPFNHCPICDKKIIRQSYSVSYQCHQRHVHRNCTTFSHEDCLLVQNTEKWYCILLNENISPFNHIETDSEFEVTLKNYMTDAFEFGYRFHDPY